VVSDNDGIQPNTIYVLHNFSKISLTYFFSCANICEICLDFLEIPQLAMFMNISLDNCWLPKCVGMFR
jgi:hypothetical protein